MDRLEVIERSRREARRGLDDLAQALARAAFLPRQPVEPSLETPVAELLESYVAGRFGGG